MSPVLCTEHSSALCATQVLCSAKQTIQPGCFLAAFTSQHYINKEFILTMVSDSLLFCGCKTGSWKGVPKWKLWHLLKEQWSYKDASWWLFTIQTVKVIHPFFSAWFLHSVQISIKRLFFCWLKFITVCIDFLLSQCNSLTHFKFL